MCILVLVILPTYDFGDDGPLGGVDGFSRLDSKLLVVGSGRSMGVAQGEERSGTVAHSRYVFSSFSAITWISHFLTYNCHELTGV